MKTKAVLEAILGGVIVAVFSYAGLRALAINAALVLRRKMPEAWFSGLIVFYSQVLVAVVALAVAKIDGLIANC